MFNYIPQLIVVVALIVIIVIVARKANKTTEVKEGEVKKTENREWTLIKKALKLFAHKAKDVATKLMQLVSSRTKEVKQEVKQKAKGIPAEKDEDELSQLAEDRPAAAANAPVADSEEILDLLEKASSLMGRSDYEGAEKLYIEIISKDAKNFRAYKGLGRIYRKQRNYDDARKSFEQALKIEPEDAEAQEELTEIKDLK